MEMDAKVECGGDDGADSAGSADGVFAVVALAASAGRLGVVPGTENPPSRLVVDNRGVV
jgi:hypothetical protein